MTARIATSQPSSWPEMLNHAPARAKLHARLIRCAQYFALAFSCLIALMATPAIALEPIVINPDDDRVEITAHGELYDNQSDRFQVETVASGNGVAGRMSVAAQVAGTNPSWLVFALTNPTGRRIERWLTADRYAIVGSGAVWPDLDARRIEAVTPSLGFLPEKIESDRADVYRVTIEPGQTITFVAELSSSRYARIYLWKPIAYELKVRERQLFNGVLLGLTGLLAIFLTAIFAANHKVIFPSAALVAWCVLAYLCIEFGFFHKLFNLRPEDNAVYRAAGEAAMAGSLVIFLYTFLRLGLGHGLVRMLFGVWILAQLALIAVAVIDPRLAATFARLSFFLIGAVGTLATLYLTFKGQDRAISLIPTWILFLVWVFAAAVTLTGRLSGEVSVAALIAGLVLVVLLIGFTVTQFAFRSLQPLYGSTQHGESQIRSLAVDGAGAATWEWNDRRNEVRVSPIVESALGLNVGELSTKVDDFITHINPNDRERFRLMLWSIQEHGGGKIRVDFRLRGSDNNDRWYDLEAASMETADRKSIRCVGLLRDITNEKRSQERLLHDAVHCSITGLPNRELFIDRLAVAMHQAKTDTGIRPTVLVVDIDKFKDVNSSLGFVVGDSLLITIARRLQGQLDGENTLARLSIDQFAILLLSEQDPRELAAQAENIRRSLRSRIKIAGREVILTGSIGIAIYDGEEETPVDLLKEAQIAMYRAKRSGADRVEIFNAKMRTEQSDKATLEDDLRTALRKKQINVLYQPIVYLPTEELAGFEALVRWQHPTRGLLNPDEFIPLAEESDLIVQLGSYVLNNSVKTLSEWQQVLPRSDAPLFVSVNVSTRQLMGAGLIQEVKQITSGSALRPGTLRLEITESLAMTNPEQAVERMNQIRANGAELALDDFGTGYSSLSYLQRFPVDTIKLDRSYVQTCYDSDRPQSAIVRSMVALAHELGKNVVAEGVEDPKDAAFLRSIGCEYAQGFYYGEAMRKADALDLLRIIRKSERKMHSQGFFRSRPKKSKGKDKDKDKARDKAAKPTTPTPAAAKTRDQSQKPESAATPAIPNRPPNGVPAGHKAQTDRATGGQSPIPPSAPPPSQPPVAAKPPASPQSPAPAPMPGSGNTNTANGGKPGSATPQPGIGASPPPVPPAGEPPANLPMPPNQTTAKAPPLTAPAPPARTPMPPAAPPVPPTPTAAPSTSTSAPPRQTASFKLPETKAPGTPPRPNAPASTSANAPAPSGRSAGRAPTNGAGTPRPTATISGLLDNLPPLNVDDPAPHEMPTPAANVSGNPPSQPPSTQKPTVDGLDADEVSSLPPGIAASLARLAGSASGSTSDSPRRLSDGGSVRPRRLRTKGSKPR